MNYKHHHNSATQVQDNVPNDNEDLRSDWTISTDYETYCQLSYCSLTTSGAQLHLSKITTICRTAETSSNNMKTIKT